MVVNQKKNLGKKPINMENEEKFIDGDIFFDFIETPTTKNINQLMFFITPKKITSYFLLPDVTHILKKEEIIKYLNKIIQFYNIPIKDIYKNK